MSMKGCPLLLVSFIISRTVSLECYRCSDAQNTNECNLVESCTEGQVCYKRREFTHKVQFDLGCIDKKRCGEYAGIQNTSYTSKMSADQTSFCYECCSNKRCNKDLCEYLPHQLCKDDKSVDCAKLNSMFSICKVTREAKKICPRFCNLCSLVDGKWSQWSPWSSCDVTCGKGTVSRYRLCNDPAPANGGLDCPGLGTEIDSCNLKSCPVHGGWSVWEPWGKCSATCGTGMRKRTRSCTNPRPRRFGDHCFGDSTEYELCNRAVCAVTDCYNIRRKYLDKQKSGIYYVRLWKTQKTIPVYCEFDTDNGGWTVFQYRFNGSLDFYRKSDEYRAGFGSLNGEFWLGLEYIYEMVSQGKTELRLDLTAFDGGAGYETFQNFQLGPGPSYTLRLDKGVGTLGDSVDNGLSYHNGQKFSTYEMGGCAVDNNGWWYRLCARTNLNSKDMYYGLFKDGETLKISRMMFRRI